MKVLVNGEARELPEGTTVAGLLGHLDLDAARRGVAVAVDAEVVRRRAWESHVLAEGMRVEVLTAIQGG
jgi:sulfur carrier protein